MTISQSLDKKVGPLPVAGWVMVVGAGVAFAMWRKRSLATSTNTPSNQSLLTDQTVGNLGALTSLMQGLNSGQTGPPMASITDNTTWARQAMSELLGRGFDPTLTDSAIRKYIAGQSLSNAEQAVIAKALEVVGALPSPPPPPPTTPSTTQPSHITTLNEFPVTSDGGGISQNLQHLSNEDLLNASNLTFQAFQQTNDPLGWAAIVGTQYGTSDPLPYLNEIARRYQAGQLPQSSLTGQVGPWTSGQPAFRLSYDDLVNRINQVQQVRGSAA